MVEISSFTSVPIRDIWSTEPGHFTPWLAENIERLGEALDIEFREAAVTEVPVGPFRLDVLAHDENGRKIAIENQYGGTDHNHLGQALTYAAGQDAEVVVWLVEEFRPEHRQALEWLNRHMQDIEFYGVQLRAVKIDDSRPVPIFEVVARPNKPSPDSKSLGGGSEEYLSFWQSVIDKLVKKDPVWRKKPKHHTYIIYWRKVVTRRPGLALNADFDIKSKEARAQIYLDPFGDRGRNHTFFDQLQEDRGEEIESQYGASLVWDKLKGKVCLLGSRLPNVSITDSESSLETTAQWMADTLITLREKVVPLVHDAIADWKELEESVLEEPETEA